MANPLLIVGGINDPNIKHLLKVACEKEVPVFPFLVEEDSSPSFFWDMINDKILLMGRKISPSAVFIRRDVFHPSSAKNHDRALAWHTALIGWIATHPKVNILNRVSVSTHINKLLVLELATNVGLSIPETYVTNNFEKLESIDTELVSKPVMGGGYCYSLESIVNTTETRLGLTANPAIVQQQIKGDDIRIFRVEDEFFGFKIFSNKVDYRQSTDYEIIVEDDLPEGIINCLSILMDELGLNWGAADFKICNRTAQWYFLEVNSNPMFSVFDRKAGGRICETVLQYLLNPLQIS